QPVLGAQARFIAAVRHHVLEAGDLQAVGGRIETGDLAQHVDAEDHLVEAVPANQGKQQRDGQDHAEAESELATDAQIAKPTFHESSPGYSLSARLRERNLGASFPPFTRGVSAAPNAALTKSAMRNRVSDRRPGIKKRREARRSGCGLRR